MKKIVLFISLCIIPLIGLAQDGEYHHYVNGRVNTLAPIFNNYEPFSSMVATGAFGLSGDIPLYNEVYLVAEGFIGFGVDNENMYTPLMFGLGVKVFFNDHLYGSLIGYPRIKIIGAGHQVYGDYPIGWITFVPAIGYRYKLDSENILFVEAGLSKDVTIFSTMDTYRDNCGLFLTFGYSYIIN